MADNVDTRFRCTHCGKLTAGRKSRNGDLSARYPRKHDFDGETCPGSYGEAIWVDVASPQQNAEGV